LKRVALKFAGSLITSDRPLVMGVLNATPDSFSDGGRWLNTDHAVRHALAMAASGADLIDVGGESTRPGAGRVSEQEELARVIPLIEKLVGLLDIPISIDTSKANVMREAVQAGAGMINDINALQADGALLAAAEARVPVCLMHMRGQPRSMQDSPLYDDVVSEVSGFLTSRAAACEQHGIPSASIVLDPGFGFGKNYQHNLELFHAIPQLAGLGYPLLIGVSRKAMLGTITGKPVEERATASVVAALMASSLGASILRVHDVAETVDAIKTAVALGNHPMGFE